MSNSQEENSFGPVAGEPLAGRRVGSGANGPRQGQTNEPVVEDPQLPLMDETETAQQRPVRGQIRLMDERSAPDPTEAGRGEMAAVPDEFGVTAPADGDYPPQEPARVTPAVAEPGGYLRLQMRVDDGEVSLVGVTRVDGPLSPPGPVHGGLAYEVSLGEQQLGAGDVPDPGVRRGFVPPDAPERGHSVVEVPSYEFTARVPLDRLSAFNLPDLQVAVYRLDSGQVVHPTANRPLRELVGRIAEEVAALRGIRTDRLPAEVRDGLERALG